MTRHTSISVFPSPSHEIFFIPALYVPVNKQHKSTLTFSNPLIVQPSNLTYFYKQTLMDFSIPYMNLK